ncbi:SDR family oxidoreductase [Brachybacterium sp. EF45031]|nr:SDR family oxidoreductase [Brachybacterium sillae]
MLPDAAGGRRLGGRRALVVGGGHGIGAATAHRLATEGARVVVADLSLEEAQRVAEELPGSGHGAVALDITSGESVTAAVAQAVAHLGGLDAVAHTSGGTVPESTRERPAEGFPVDDEQWTQLLDLNLVGAARVARETLPALRESAGALVAVSSVNAAMAWGGLAYSSAKAGLEALVRNLASDHAAAGVRINAVAPGTVRTRVWQGRVDILRPLYPLGRVGEPEDIAAAITYLLSPDAAWVTGQVLTVDGGVSLRGPGPR